MEAPAKLGKTSPSKMLLESNRAPTDIEHGPGIIQESTVSTDAQLREIEPQISQATAHIPAIEHTEIELEFPHNQKAVILETVADTRRVLSSISFDNMPKDVLREICIVFIGADFPTLTFRMLPLPYQLMQISSGLRRIVLTTPSIWSAINIQLRPYYTPKKRMYTALVYEARKWLERAGGLLLDISVENLSEQSGVNDDDEFASDPAPIVFDFLLDFSSQWKSIRLACSIVPTFITRLVALSAVDVPQLRSISLTFFYNTSILRNSKLFKIPTLEHLTLEPDWSLTVPFAINLALLTSLTLRSCPYNKNPSSNLIGTLLRRTKRLEFCSVSVAYDRNTSVDHPNDIIDLPFLKTLHVDEKLDLHKSSDVLDLINAPNLESFQLHGISTMPSASAFFTRSPNIRELSLRYGESLTDIIELLQYCPSLTKFSLRPHWTAAMKDTLDCNQLLETFVQGDVVPCPHLEYFTLWGTIDILPLDISLQTLRQFLGAKQRGIAPQDSILRPWRGVGIDLRAIADMELRQQMLILFAQKLKEGVSVGALPEEEIRIMT